MPEFFFYMENCFEYRRVFILFCIDEAAFDLKM